VLELAIIENILPLSQLARQDQLAVKREPVVLLEIIVEPVRLIIMNAHQARIITDNVGILANDIGIGMMSQSMLVDPNDGAQSSVTLIVSAQESPRSRVA